MKLQNTFVGSKLNQDIDERLLPKGQYPDAHNIRVANSDGSDMGAIENLQGNYKLTNIDDDTATVIGAISDGSNEKIYYFVTSDIKDMVIEHDLRLAVTNVLLQSSAGGVLNFNRDYLITGINKVINEDSDKDLLFWTDDINPPRVINIARFSGSAIDSFVESDIAVIKAPPPYAPTYTFSIDTESSYDSMEDRFFSFAYRFKYIDGEYSALSSFTNYAFSPNNLDIDFDTLENRGMRNTTNALNITMNTGNKNVVEVQLVVKESNSNTVFIVETFNKEDEIFEDDFDFVYHFLNDKTMVALPVDELFRTYDNVPVLAKAQDYVNNRMMYGNYVEGFDIKDINGNDINVKYSTEVVSTTLDGEDLPVTLQNGDSDINIYVQDLSLFKDTRFTIFVSLLGVGDNIGNTYTNSHVFIFERDYVDLDDLMTSTEFGDFIDIIMSEIFFDTNTSSPPVNTSSSQDFPYTFSYTNNVLTITSPYIIHTIDLTPLDDLDDNFLDVRYDWEFTDITEADFKLESTSASLKSLRNLETGVIYEDAYGRKTTVLLSNTNTVDVPQSLASMQNKLKVQMNSLPPADAVRYKFAVKQNRGFYENIFCTKFYEDESYVWIKLEESSKDKVHAGDILYVKRDSDGILNASIKVTVLEVSIKESNFIEGNYFNQSTGELVDGAGADIIELIEPAGIYMKIKPVGFNMNYNANTFFDGRYFDDSDSTTPSVELKGERSLGVFFPITQGATVRLGLTNTVQNSSRSASAVRTYISSSDYVSFREFWLAEVGLAPIVFDTGVAESGASFVIWDNMNYIGATAIHAGYGSKKTSSFFTSVTITNSNGLTVFETVPDINISEIYYETSETFDIKNGYHLGKEQDQTSFQPAEITLDFFNCFAMGENIESIAYLDAFNKPYLNIDLRPSSTSIEKFKRVRRFADVTYSGVYNENTNLNGLNDFNLSTANFKEDLDKKYGFIQRIYARDTNLVIFQEDKVSYVLFGKDLLMNADGSSNVTSTQQILGQQVPYQGEYGMSTQAESFAFNGGYIYWTDTKRGAVCRLGNNGIVETSKLGMDRFFKDEFKDTLLTPKIAAFDPYYDQYVLFTGQNVLTHDEKVKGWTSFFDYRPEYMVGMNNRFFSFSKGELYEHYHELADRNTFYGEFFESRVSIMVNDKPSDIKELQAVSLEGNYPWSIELAAFVGMSNDVIPSTISASEFVRKEGIWYAYARRNESTHFDSKSSYGIGTVSNIAGTTLTVTGFNSSLTSGDVIVRGSDLLEVGTIQSHSTVDNITTLELDVVDAGLLVDDFIFGTKDSRVEGGNLRGYVIRMNLGNKRNDKVELFAVNSEVMKSFS